MRKIIKSLITVSFLLIIYVVLVQLFLLLEQKNFIKPKKYPSWTIFYFSAHKLLFPYKIRQTQIECPLGVKTEIEKLLPKKTFLRDCTEIPLWLHGLVPLDSHNRDLYLFVYIENGYQSSFYDFNSCPGEIMGTALRGNYHLALFQKNQIIDDIVLPKSGYQDQLELPYLNTKENLYEKGEYLEKEKNKLEKVKLLTFKNYTGSNRDLDLILTTTGGGCGFYDSLVAGYDEGQNKIILYSGWIGGLNPDRNGESYVLFSCGNHGNTVQSEIKYKFNPTSKKFEKIYEKETPCD